MSYEISWVAEHRIIRSRLSGTLTVQEAEAVSAVTTEYLNRGVAPVHLIIDVTTLERFPTNVAKNVGLAGYLRHASLGWTIVIGGNALVNFALNVIGQVLKFQFTKRDNLEDAVAFLQKQDATLKIGTESNHPAAAEQGDRAGQTG